MLPKECRHIKTDGRKCHGMAMRGEYYCYAHHPKRRRPAPSIRSTKPRYFLELPLLEDRGAIQAAISETFRAILLDEIDLNVAGQMLYALQLTLSRRTGTPPVTQASPRYLKVAPVPGFTRLYCTEKNQDSPLAAAATDAFARAYPQLQSPQ